MPLSTTDKIVNAVLFQLCWLCAIFWHTHYALLLLFCLVIHSAMTYLNPKLTTKLLGLAAVGIVIDSALMHASVYQFDGNSLTTASGIIPLWLCILWVGFMLTLCSSLAWLMQHPKFFVLACAIAGPISYASGRKFDALYFEQSALIIIAVEWIVMGVIAVITLKPTADEPYVEMNKNYV